MRLRELHHGSRHSAERILQAYLYDVDARGNRTRTREVTPRTTGSGTNTTIAATDAGIVYTGMWQADGSFQRSTAPTARLGLLFFGTTGIELTMGTGPDHSRFDVYIDGSLWQAFDGYAATAGERTIPLELTGAGAHLLEIRNRREKSASSSGYVVRFKQLVAQAAYTVRQIDYQYDALSRLIAAVYSNAPDYAYAYDAAGNLTNNNGVTRTFNAANQMTGDGTNTYEYDNNGNLLKINGVNSYTWDRANRLLAFGGIAYAYNGDGNRVSQTANAIVTKYLLDTQPGLALVIAQTTGANTERYIHVPRGIHAVESPTGDWSYQMQDGLGSVRGVIDANGLVTQSMGYSPYGVPDSEYEWAFTGEQRDATGVQFHRARYYAPEMGVWVSLDPIEIISSNALHLNRYIYVIDNPINNTDSSGLFDWNSMLAQANDCVYCIARETGVGIHPFDRNIGRVPTIDEMNADYRNNFELAAFREIMKSLNSSSKFIDMGNPSNPWLKEGETYVVPDYLWVAATQSEFFDLTSAGKSGRYKQIPYTCPCSSIPPTFTPSPTATSTGTPTPRPTNTSTPPPTSTLAPTIPPIVWPPPTATPSCVRGEQPSGNDWNCCLNWCMTVRPLRSNMTEAELDIWFEECFYNSCFYPMYPPEQLQCNIDLIGVIRNIITLIPLAKGIEAARETGNCVIGVTSAVYGLATNTYTLVQAEEEIAGSCAGLVSAPAGTVASIFGLLKLVITGCQYVPVPYGASRKSNTYC